MSVFVFHYAVATVAFTEDMYVVSETAGTLTPSVTILSSSLPEGTNIAFNVSTAPDSATGQWNVSLGFSIFE